MTTRYLRLFALPCMVGLSAASGAAAQTCSGTITEAEALQAEAARTLALTSNDFAAMERLFGDDLVYNHSTTTSDDKSTYIGRMRSGQVRYRTITPNADTMTRTFGCVAVLTGTAVYETTIGGKDGTGALRYTVVWAKRPAGLAFVSWQSTAVPAKAP